MDIKCRTCNDEFKHTVVEEIRCKKRGWENDPGRCAKCVNAETRTLLDHVSISSKGNANMATNVNSYTK